MSPWATNVWVLYLLVYEVQSHTLESRDDKVRSKKRVYIWVSVWWKTKRVWSLYDHTELYYETIIRELEFRLEKLFVYHESIKWELKIKSTYECLCDERLKTKAEEFTRLGYTGLIGGLEHLKIESRLIDEKKKKFEFYYESRKRELQTKPIYECRYDERLKTKSEKSTRLSYTGLLGELEHKNECSCKRLKLGFWKKK